MNPRRMHLVEMRKKRAVAKACLDAYADLFLLDTWLARPKSRQLKLIDLRQNILVDELRGSTP